MSNPLANEGNGKLKTVGSIFDNCIGNQVTSNDSIFTPTYGRTLDASANVPALVNASAGKR